MLSPAGMAANLPREFNPHMPVWKVKGHLSASQTCYCSISCSLELPVLLRRIIHSEKKRTLVSRTESHLLSELTRQITPPTKNGRAPPPTKSRKCYQSVNPSRVGANGQKKKAFPGETLQVKAIAMLPLNSWLICFDFLLHSLLVNVISTSR
jgi:hypothetical protein